jgi:hypothetical protein
MVVCFGNAYKCYVGFRTKGFWHNQNGLAILDANPGWIADVNGLDPYKGNPFDGNDAAGNPVPAAQGPAGETIAAAGTALAEISEYLVAPVNGDDKVQLQEQLLAFIFNCKNNNVVTMQLPDGTWATSGAIIDSAIAAWNAGGADAIYWSGVLDACNNLEGTSAGTGVPIVCPDPGPIQY